MATNILTPSMMREIALQGKSITIEGVTYSPAMLLAMADRKQTITYEISDQDLLKAGSKPSGYIPISPIGVLPGITIPPTGGSGNGGTTGGSSGLVGALTGVGDELLTAITTFWSGITSGVRSFFTGIWEAISNWFRGLTDKVKTQFINLIEWIRQPKVWVTIVTVTLVVIIIAYILPVIGLGYTVPILAVIALLWFLLAGRQIFNDLIAA